MILYTPVERPEHLFRLTHATKIMLLGSCFTSNIGKKLAEAKFCCDMNPYGILYNPLSISFALREIVANKRYTQKDLFFFQERWHSAMHHGDFSSSDVTETLDKINIRLEEAHKHLSAADCLLLTFGTAWVYEDKSTQCLVANCHKQPEACFTRRKLTVDEIVSEYKTLIADLLERNSQLKILFTVSPIRHIRDGMHANSLSKATLLLAIEQLQDFFPDCVSYFPAYEIVLDELRDYRFYAEDMVHPSEVAIQYIWDCFVQTCISEDSLEIMKESEKICKALSHKPFYPDSDEYKRFLEQIMLKIERLNGKYPYLDFKKEREVCHIRLKA